MISNDSQNRQLSWGTLHKVALAYSIIVFLMCIWMRIQGAKWTDLVHYGGAHVSSVLFAIYMRRALSVKAPWLATLLLVFSAALAYETAIGLTKVLPDLNIASALAMAMCEQVAFVASEHIQDLERRNDRKHAVQDVAPPPGMATGVAVVAAAAPSAASLPAHVTMPAPLERPAAVSTTYRGHADAKAHAIALATEKPKRTQVQIAAIVGVPRSTVGRWLRETKSDG